MSGSSSCSICSAAACAPRCRFWRWKPPEPAAEGVGGGARPFAHRHQPGDEQSPGMRQHGRSQEHMTAKKRTTTRIAAIGVGYWGKNLVRNFAELGALAAICDPDRAVAQALADRHGTIVADVAAVFGDPSIAGVAIAAPAALHTTLARAAIEAGKHVFVEKPLGLTVAAAAELCALAERADR